MLLMPENRNLFCNYYFILTLDVNAVVTLFVVITTFGPWYYKHNFLPPYLSNIANVVITSNRVAATNTLYFVFLILLFQ